MSQPMASQPLSQPELSQVNIADTLSLSVTEHHMVNS
jgi:hypothetical protein